MIGSIHKPGKKLAKRPTTPRACSLLAMSINSGHRHSWCPHATSILDFSDACIRDAWASLTPAALVSLFILVSLLRRIFANHQVVPENVKRIFRPFLTVEEAEALEGGEEDFKPSTGTKPTWRTVLFSVVGLLQTLVWLGHASFHLYTDSPKKRILGGLFPFLVACSWLYTSLRPIVRPSLTPQYDVLAVYVALLCGGSLKLAGALYHSHWVPLDWIAVWLNAFGLVVVLSVILSMPLNIPGRRVDKEEIVSFTPFAALVC